MKIKLNDKVLLVNNSESHLFVVERRKVNIQSGIVNLGEVIGKSFGYKIKTHIGKEFITVKPTLLDIFEKSLTRGAQVILPKDAGMILAYTGIQNDSTVVDAGSGTGYLALFLANYLERGKVITYEKDRRFIKLSKNNFKISGFKNIKLRNSDVTKGINENNVDLVTLDLQDANKVIKHAYKSLKFGGWIVVYSPTIEHLVKILKEIKGVKFSNMRIIENIVREWQSEHTTRPKTMGLMHTGWITFARKMHGVVV